MANSTMAVPVLHVIQYQSILSVFVSNMSHANGFSESWLHRIGPELLATRAMAAALLLPLNSIVKPFSTNLSM